MDTESLLTILVALSGSMGIGGIANAIQNIRKASKDDVRKLNESLAKCEENCFEAKKLANEFKAQAEDWRMRFNRLEEDGKLSLNRVTVEADARIQRWQEEATSWRERFDRKAEEADDWRNRWMNEVGR